MKKSLLTAVLAVGTCFSAMAQTADHFQSDALKPTANSLSTEFGLTGGILNSDFNLAEGGLLKFRYFLHEDLAFRLGLNLANTTERTKVFNPTNTENGSLIENQFAFQLNLGIEKHFAGTRNLSPYVGGDIIIANLMSREEGTEVDYHTNSYALGHSFKTNGPKQLAIGVRGVIGADFYVMKHVYIGAEAGLGFYYGSEADYSTVITTPAGTTTHDINGVSSDLILTPQMTAGVRIGFIF